MQPPHRFGGKYAYNTIKQVNTLELIPGVIIYVTCGSQTHVSNWLVRSNEVSVGQVVAESGLTVSKENVINWKGLTKENQKKYRPHKLGGTALLRHICEKEDVRPQQLRYVGKEGICAAQDLGFAVYPVDSPDELNKRLKKLLQELGGKALATSQQAVDRSYMSKSGLFASAEFLLGGVPRESMTAYGTGRVR